MYQEDAAMEEMDGAEAPVEDDGDNALQDDYN